MKGSAPAPTVTLRPLELGRRTAWHLECSEHGELVDQGKPVALATRVLARLGAEAHLRLKHERRGRIVEGRARRRRKGAA